ncbi:hypothetical protein AEGHOMDF_0626 [Methylobacterium soli]|nr:hypothetical protein AEGHOMDF_0626 [Methylobacterium soli]
MRHPDLLGAGLPYGAAEVRPVRMVRDDKGQLDALLARPRPHPHPPRREGGDGVGELARPDVLDRGGRAQHDGAVELGALGRHHLRGLAEPDALALVELGQLLHGAVQVDRPVVAGLPQQRHDALRLAERVGADDVGALGKQGHGGQELGDLLAGIGHPEHRQPEGRLGDEDVAGHDLEGQAGGIARPLVIARDHDAHALGLDGDLGRAQHVAGGGEAHRDVADADRLAELGLLARAAEILAVAHRHDPQGLARGEDAAVPGAGMVGMPMRDQRPRHRPGRIDVEAPEGAVQTFAGQGEEIAGA